MAAAAASPSALYFADFLVSVRLLGRQCDLFELGLNVVRKLQKLLPHLPREKTCLFQRTG